MLKPLLPNDLQGAASELALYWIDSFGNKTRIDYGEFSLLSSLVPDLLVWRTCKTEAHARHPQSWGIAGCKLCLRAAALCARNR